MMPVLVDPLRRGFDVPGLLPSKNGDYLGSREFPECLIQIDPEDRKRMLIINIPE